MKYDVTWIKALSYSDLAMCNCLSQMRLYHYNVRTPADVSKSVRLQDADAPGILKVTVLLKTRDDESFQLSYFMNQREAETFRDMFINEFTAIYDG